MVLCSSPNSSIRPHSTFSHQIGLITYNIEIAFEVRVRTQSLSVVGQTNTEALEESLTAATLSQIDATMMTLSNLAIDLLPISIWTTKEANACVLTALLFKMTPILK